jgi:hypothetical protein
MHAWISFAQTGSNLREILIPAFTDSLKLDSLSMIKGSEILIFAPDSKIDTSSFYINYTTATIFFKKPPAEEVKIIFRVFPYDFSHSWKNKSISMLEPDQSGAVNPFYYTYDRSNDNDIFKLQGLNKNGSISRGVTFGNNQDLAVNSNMNLQLSGKINENVSILAAITDNNIPIQPEGNTYQLQDFDQVYIQVFDEKSKLIAGDFQLSRPNSYFMNFYKRAQGGNFSTTVNPVEGKKGELRINTAAAVSRGKFSRFMVQGQEGIQGPYRLRGAENETFIIVLSGTENVYIDGVLMKRGQEHDYIIDYNAAEITFTANQIITKDKRVIVEFQYSDRNYARSLFFIGNEYEDDKLKVNFNFYSEQDAKNQPLMQDLDPEKRELMSNIGDSIHQAFFSSVDSVGFSPSLVLYKKADTLVNEVLYSPIYIYSTNPDSAIYRIAFSFVGQGNGNYRQIRSTANGKVFEWIAPLNGVPQGSFEPISILITPKKTQMLTAGGEYKINKYTKTFLELAVSNHDINTFSNLHSENNTDIGFRTGIENNKPLNPQSENSWVLTSLANYEQVNENFNRIERFRPIEFERDWNILNRNFTQSQHITTFGAGLSKKQTGKFNYLLSTFNTPTEYNAFRNLLDADFRKGTYEFSFTGSYLKSDGFETKSDFIRHRSRISKHTKHLSFGLWEDFERNIMRHPATGNLQLASYQYFEWEAFVTNSDTAINKYGLRYRQRYDDLPFENNLTAATFGESITFDFGLNKNPNSVLRGSSTYRRLTITNSYFANYQPEETVLGRLEYSLKVLKGTISSVTFYESGSGMEIKREFIFIEVAAGQGTHAYIGDLNNNGVKDLDEFEVTNLPDLRRYIKIFTPTNEFVRVYSNQFNQVLNIDPNRIWGNKEGIKKLASRFATQSAYRIDRRTGIDDVMAAYNPFFNDVRDTALITLNSSMRNTLFFNRTNPKFGLDYSRQDIRNKNILVNGFEARTHSFNSLRSRWNITREIAWLMAVTQGEKTSESEFLTNRNFLISYYELEPRVNYQPGTTFRMSFMYKYTEKKNKPAMGGETALTHNLGTEVKYNILSKGSLLFNVNYILNEFNAADNTLLSFEMLEGLQIGRNLTWGLSYQRNLSGNMQLSLNYMGRTSETAPTVHTGGVQVRAFF